MAKKPKAPHIPKFSKIIKAFEHAQEIVEVEVAQFAEDETEAFRTRIEAQDFPSFHAEHLNPAYKARKIQQGLDPRVMIRTANYVDRIKVYRRKLSKRSTKMYIGFHKRLLARDEKGQRTPFLMTRLARVQEKGSEKLHIPPRPHWWPHYQEMHWRAVPLRKRIKKRIRASVRKVMPGMIK